MTLTGYRADSRHPDLLLTAAVILIGCGSLLAIGSAMHGTIGASAYIKKQAFGIVIGLAAMMALAYSDYTKYLPRAAATLTAINIALLFIVLVIHGHSSHGATRWLPLGPIQFQPSEFAKLALIISLAVYLARRRENITSPKVVLGSLGVIAIPFVLIFKQPDLGTGLVVIAMWFGMLFIAGARLWQLAALVTSGLLVFVLLWHSPIKWLQIKDYQKQRMISFIYPDADQEEDTGYHLRQSQIAIGAGEVLGQGYGKGMQEQGQFIPEQHTDFIFTVVGEEGGFVGAIALLALYFFVLQRSIWVIVTTKDYFGRLLTAGVIAVLAFHVIVNVGMTIGVMPVTGVPLPFFSYGLSALIIDMAAVGIVLSVQRRTQEMMF